MDFMARRAGIGAAVEACGASDQETAPMTMTTLRPMLTSLRDLLQLTPARRETRKRILVLTLLVFAAMC
jgi:hypothetical protein